MYFIVAIDGISGAGKTTAGKALAEKLKFNHISSGNLYRAITHYLIVNKIPLNLFEIKEALSNASFSFLNIDGICVNGKLLNVELRESVVEENLDIVVQIPSVRNAVKNLIQIAVAQKSCVIDGRDVGTIMYPMAVVKFFFVKNVKQKMLAEKLETGNLQINDFRGLEARDISDIQRKIAPLRKANDAITIFSFEQSLEELFAKLERLVLNRISQTN